MPNVNLRELWSSNKNPIPALPLTDGQWEYGTLSGVDSLYFAHGGVWVDLMAGGGGSVGGSGTEHFLPVWGVDAFTPASKTLTDSILRQNAAGTFVGVGTSPAHRVHILGLDTLSTTTTLFIENSSNLPMLRLLNNNRLFLGVEDITQTGTGYTASALAIEGGSGSNGGQRDAQIALLQYDDTVAPNLAMQASRGTPAARLATLDQQVLGQWGVSATKTVLPGSPVVHCQVIQEGVATATSIRARFGILTREFDGGLGSDLVENFTVMPNNGFVGRGFTNPLAGLDLDDGLRVRAQANFTLTGTVDVTAGSDAITGTGTLFLTELVEGDEITIAGETRVILTIASDISATAQSDWTATVLGSAATAVKAQLITRSSAGIVGVVVDSDGKFRYADGTQGAGRVLVSDANGVASWSAFSAAGLVSGSGTLTFFPKWTPDGVTLGDSDFSNPSAGSFSGVSTVNGRPQINFTNDGAGGVPASFNFRRSLSGGVVANGTSLFQLAALGHDGSGYVTSSRVRFLAEGTVSTGIVPGKIVFETSNQVGAFAIRAQIDMEGNVGIGTVPTTKLHLDGALGFRYVDGNEAAGLVLVSDANGVGSWGSVAGTGDVVGPAASTDNALARFDAATGKLIQNSSTILSDASILSGLTLVLNAGTAAANSQPIKLTSGLTLTVSEAGVFEYDGNNLYFTIAATRGTVFVGNDSAAAPSTSLAGAVTNRYGGSTNFLGDPVDWAEVIINSTTFKIPLYT